MKINPVLFALITYVLTFIIAMMVAGIIKLIYLITHKSEPKKAEAK